MTTNSSKKAAPKGCLGNLLLLLVTSVLMLAAGEWYVRYTLYHTNDAQLFLRYASIHDLYARPEFAARYLRFAPHRYLGYFPTPNFERDDLTHNSLGYKDDEIALPKPPDEFRVVCMGGSTTYTATVGNTQFSYPKLLEKELRQQGYSNVRVINAGCDGYTSYESLINYAFRISGLDPDMLIVMDGLNDTLARIVWPHEAYKGDNSGFRVPLQDNVVLIPWYDQSALVRAVRVRLGFAESHFALRTLYDLQNGANFLGFEWEEQQAKGTYPQGILRDISLAQMLEANTDAYLLRNLSYLIAMAQADGVKTVVVSTPRSPQAVPRAGTRPIVTSPDFLSAWSKSDQGMKALAERTGAAWYDLAADYPQNADLFDDGMHTSLEGTQETARIMSKWLMRSGLLPQPSQVSSPVASAGTA